MVLQVFGGNSVHPHIKKDLSFPCVGILIDGLDSYVNILKLSMYENAENNVQESKGL